MRHLPALLLCVLAACGGGGGSSEPLSPQDDPPEVLFCRSRIDARQSDSQIRRASSRGLGDRRVIDRPGVESGVRLAPDGNRLAFTRERHGDDPDSREIFVGTYDGSVGELRLTVDSVLDDHPCWSPDGERIVFSSERLGQGRRLFLIRPDGSDAIPLYDDGAEQRSPDWSWANERIAYARVGASGRSEIWVVDRDGRIAAPVTDGGAGAAAGSEAAGDHDPAWSPDGAGILFARDVGPGIRVLAHVDVQSGVVAVLTPPDGFHARPRWSPIGDRVFFAADRPGEGIAGGRLWSARPDGTERVLVFADKRHEFVGFDALPSIRPVPSDPTEEVAAVVSESGISNGIGRRSRGTLDAVLRQDGVVYGISTVSNGIHQVAGLEFDVPLPVPDPKDALVVEFSATLALTESDPTSVLRLSIANYPESRNDTVVEQAPTGATLRTLTFRLASLQHVSREAHVRLAVIGQNPLEQPGELLIDDVSIHVVRPAPPGESR